MAHFLVEIDFLYRARHATGHSLSLLMSRSEIADYLGLTIETVSRSFSKLRKDGIIRLIESDEVVILDHRKLRAIGKS